MKRLKPYSISCTASTFGATGSHSHGLFDDSCNLGYAKASLGTLLQFNSSIATAIAWLSPAGHRAHHFVVTWEPCGVLLTTLIMKATLYAYCHGVPQDSAQALAEDNFNDCLSNVVMLVTLFLACFLALLIGHLRAIIFRPHHLKLSLDNVAPHRPAPRQGRCRQDSHLGHLSLI